ncbi:hypothetical protein EDD37DRAFT_4337 [Exophiala viscosa]|uniref:Uncharacterized protein n=1 Tax=Exophiala viscosa TaxID=2486360 RepID=A0AAN6DM05_9EURO|nr:hypothetical protein EDD36DRAFT_114728 [Exophiala viscosa]KAI1628401.1 hypothetical protein EDD37DRAFT_4337 [Exophiala viscosa]
MSLVTQTITDTTTALASTVIVGALTTTVTSHISTTVLATFGQTVTITSPPASPPLAPTTKYTPSTVATETSIVTLTEIDIFLQNTQGSIYSTWVVPFTPTSNAAGPSSSPTVIVYVVEPKQGGWHTWSAGAKAGLIVGVVLAGLLLLGMLIWCCCRRSNVWFVHGWPWSRPLDAAPPPNMGPSIVQPTMVNGPLMPYVQPHPGYA